MSEHKPWISPTVAEVRLSAIKEMAMLSARVEDVASLAWGLPSFRTPEHIREAVNGALARDDDIGKYALPNGLPALREIVAQHHCRKTGVAADKDENVFITAGNMQGLNSLLRTVLEPGDEILVTDPGFASHIQQIHLYGGKAVLWSPPVTQPAPSSPRKNSGVWATWRWLTIFSCLSTTPILNSPTKTAPATTNWRPERIWRTSSPTCLPFPNVTP